MDFSIARRRMVQNQVVSRGVSDQRVIDAMLKVPRHLFVEEAFQSQAYTDFALPIGERQTISQPYIVALMTEALELKGTEKVLEIGTGSGYQAAVLAQVAGKVYSVERHSALARRARKVLDETGNAMVNLKVSDGTYGWEEEVPFDGIIVTAGAPSIPQKYLEQLAVGGRLVIPVGGHESQKLMKVTRTSETEYAEETLVDCRFVPLLGRFGWSEGE